MGHHGPGVVRLLLSLRLTVLPALQVLAEQAADAPRAFPTEYRTDNFEDASAWLNLDIARQGYAEFGISRTLTAEVFSTESGRSLKKSWRRFGLVLMRQHSSARMVKF